MPGSLPGPPASLPKAPTPGPTESGGPRALPLGALPRIPKPEPKLELPEPELQRSSSNESGELVSAVSSVTKQAEITTPPSVLLRLPAWDAGSPFRPPIFCGPAPAEVAGRAGPDSPREAGAGQAVEAAVKAKEEPVAVEDGAGRASEAVTKAKEEAAAVEDAAGQASNAVAKAKEEVAAVEDGAGRASQAVAKAKEEAAAVEDAAGQASNAVAKAKEEVAAVEDGAGRASDAVSKAKEEAAAVEVPPASVLQGAAATSSDAPGRPPAMTSQASVRDEPSEHTAEEAEDAESGSGDSDATVKDGCDLNRHAEDVARWTAEAPAVPAQTTPVVEAEPRRPRRQRVTTLPPTARASDRSSQEEVQRVFQQMNDRRRRMASLEDLRAYLGDGLGFGQAEIERFFERTADPQTHGVTVDSLLRSFSHLNPFQISERSGELIIRKPGSLHGQQVNLEALEDCQVFICDTSAQVFMDYCSKSCVLLGPCQSSASIRNCEDCTVWCAAQQLRTRDCKRCTFYLYTKTAPIIESSYDLTIAPWCAKYPCSGAHFDKMGFDVTRNMWNAVFDFSGEKDRPHWRIPGLQELEELVVSLDGEGPPENRALAVTHERLCAEPLQSEESCGQGLAIPQPRPPLPSPPGDDAAAVSRTRRVVDQPGKTSPAITEMEESWICRHCTLQNSPGEASCAACRQPRIGEGTLQSFWTCPICTLQNSTSQSRCAACGHRLAVAPSAGFSATQAFSEMSTEPPKKSGFCSFLAEAVRPLCMKSKDMTRT
ncbi:unnamed protein product [Effrenium voratum]|uniref:RanBP2-type domain-containing protein n=1 Tax=Effrenium voratum TaxID=2562239 RepID=A0AA36ILC2_9DINO|nr:unnamed protein product [Effrenium voratum]